MILIIDDHLDTGAALAALMKRKGHDAVAVGSATAGLQLLKSVVPQVIVLDVMMPEMDGLEVLRRVRAEDRLSRVPVVMFSADFTHDRYRSAMELGANEYLVKGAVGWDEVYRAVAQYVEPPQARS
jgi:DNA-binding response OmpR family regulator